MTPTWKMPVTVDDAYGLLDRVEHNGSVWESTVPENVWEPGTLGWRPFDPEADVPPPKWHRLLPYSKGDRVTHGGARWRSTAQLNDSEPGVVGSPWTEE